MPDDELFDNRRSFERKAVHFDAILTPLTFKDKYAGYGESIETSTENISASGALFEFPVTPDNSTFYLIHLKTEDDSFPKFVLGQIKWSDTADIDDDEGAFGGVEFIIEEKLTKDTLMKQLENLPQDVHQFDRETQAAFQKYLDKIIGNQSR